MLSSTEGWAVGSHYSTGIVRYYDGISEEWQNFPNLENPCLCIDMLSRDDGWIGGYGPFWHWNGVNWNKVNATGSVPSDDFCIDGISMLNPSYGWAVGHEFSNPSQHKGIAFLWNGYVWEFFGVLCEGGLHTVHTISEQNAWAAGDGGQVFNWNGTSWNQVFSRTSKDIMSISMLAIDDGWAVGGGGMATGGTSIHWNGSQWESVALPEGYTDRILKSVFVIDHNDVWACGQDVIIHWNGSNWELSADIPSIVDGWPHPLWALGFSSSTNGWVVGQAVFGHWLETDLTPPTISQIAQFPEPHNVNYNDTVEINATITDESGIDMAELDHRCLYLNGTESSWINTTMFKIGTDLFSGTIPSYPIGTRVLFVITAKDNVGNLASTETLPVDLEYTVISEYPLITTVFAAVLVITFAIAMGAKMRKRSTNSTYNGLVVP